MWLWIAVTSIPWSRSALRTGFTSFAISTKSPVIAALPPPLGLEVDRIGRTHRRRYIHSIILDRFGSGDAELVDAPVIGALGAERLIESDGIEIDWRWRGRSGWSGRKGRLAFGERRVEHRRQFHRIAIALHMHVHRERLIAQEVVVQCGYFDPACGELCHDRSDHVHRQHEITHHHALVAHFLEGEPAAERKAGFQLDAVQSDPEI